MLNFIMYANILLISIGAFFDNKTVKNIIKFFTLPTTIISFVGLMPMIMGILGEASFYSYHFRGILMAIEMGIVLAFSIIILITDNFYKITKKWSKIDHFLCFLMISMNF